MNFIDTTKAIQRHVGAEPDGVFGPLTAGKVLAELQRGAAGQDMPLSPPEHASLDARSAKVIESLDPKCREQFTDFLLLCKATAATFGCDYRLISGYRSWEEQDALYKQKPKVTNARGGYSFHNFGIAADGGCFQQDGAVYLDGGTIAQQALAEKIHTACAVHAKACGLVWGGAWTGFKDPPHWQVNLGRATPNDEDRALYKAKGSIL